MTRFLPVGVVTVAAALSIPGTAAASTPRGAIVPLHGHGSCVAVRGRDGCDRGRAVAGGSDVVVSPDGRNVYVAANRGIASFARSRSTGKLVQLRGAAGCCSLRRGPAYPRRLAISGDGRNVYASGRTASGAAALAVFARNPTTGTLTQLPGTDGCIVAITTPAQTPSCAQAREPGGDSAAVSPDGLHVYTGGGGIGVFMRDAATGALSEVPGEDGCVEPGANHVAGCRQGRSMGNGRTRSLAATADGRNIYTAVEAIDEEDRKGVATFLWDAASGALTQPSQPGACRLARALFAAVDGCRPLFGFTFDDLAATPDGRSVYLAEGGDETGMGDDIGGGLVSLRRQGTDGALTEPRGHAGCVGFEYSSLPGSCGRAHGVMRANGLAISPDSRSVYVADVTGPSFRSGRGAIGVFSRNRRSGALLQLRGRFGCASRYGRCIRTRSIGYPGAVTVSPDGRNAYVAADSGVTGFRRVR